ncbi:MAG: DUF4389 domain-containing protein [Pseudomonadota bacterium]
MTTPAADFSDHGPSDATPAEGGRSDREPIWQRGAYMLLFVIAFSLAQSLHTLIAVVQFLALLLLGEPNRRIAEFGAGLAEWTRETSRFLTCASDERPWPIAPWPTPRA